MIDIDKFSNKNSKCVDLVLNLLLFDFFESASFFQRQNVLLLMFFSDLLLIEKILDHGALKAVL